MITISLCMIVNNDESTLGRCLQSSAGVFDEIIIVDLGSNDKTADIAHRYTDKVYNYAWNNDFASARNFSFSKASCEYILWLDANDVILPTDLNKLRILKKVMQRSIDIVMMKYDIDFDDNGNTISSCYRERLLKKNAYFQWQEPVNEYIPIKGRATTADVTITRINKQNLHPDRNIEIYRNMIDKGVVFSSENTFHYANELKIHGMQDEAISQYEKFLISNDSPAEDYINACFELSFLYRYRQDYESMFGVLLQSLKYASPRAEICCQIGEYHFGKGSFKEAVFWYELALELKKPFSWRFMYEDYWGYIPALQLCLCYYNLGDIRKADEYNQVAKKFKPFDSSVTSNEKFFSNIKKQNHNDY